MSQSIIHLMRTEQFHFQPVKTTFIAEDITTLKAWIEPIAQMDHWEPLE
jgi:hypothetical protein